MTDLWMPGAAKIPTAAYWAGMDPAFPTYRGYMIHIMQGYQTTMDRWARERPMRTKKSAHSSVARSGRKVQYVALGDRSWSAGRACAEGWVLVDPAQASSVPINQRRSMNHTLWNVECEGFSKPPGYGYDYVYGPAHPWPEPLLAGIVEFGVFFFTQTGLAPDPLRIIGHRDTDGCTRADDPGDAFPMVEVQERIAAGVLGSPVAPPPRDPGVGGLQEAIDALVAEDARQAAILSDHETRLARPLAR